MDPNTDGDRAPLGRALLAAVLALVAVDSFRKRKRLLGALAGAGAVAVGYAATDGVDVDDLPDLPGVEDVDGLSPLPGVGATDEAGTLRCAICGEPIRPGQRRGPNEDDEIVHEACMGASDRSPPLTDRFSLPV